jgi:hypothetical protein
MAAAKNGNIETLAGTVRAKVRGIPRSLDDFDAASRLEGRRPRRPNRAVTVILPGG